MSVLIVCGLIDCLWFHDVKTVEPISMKFDTKMAYTPVSLFPLVLAMGREGDRMLDGEFGRGWRVKRVGGYPLVYYNMNSFKSRKSFAKHQLCYCV